MILITSLTFLSFCTLSGCSENTTNTTPSPTTQTHSTPSTTPQKTLSPEEEKLIKNYTKPTTDPQGNTVEATDPLVQLLSE